MADNGGRRGERQYPNLLTCQVALQSSGGAAAPKPPVRLPGGCTEALERSIAAPTVYNFALGKSIAEHEIIAAVDERTHSQTIATATTRAELWETLLEKMKSVTNAEESICIALLESNCFDLKASIEAYFMNH